MKSYDLVYVVRPDLEQDALKALVERMSQRITDQGGTIEAVDQWGKRRMSFSTKKNREGVFVHTRFSVDPAKVAEIRRGVNLIEEVLRATLTNAVGKLPEPKTAEAPAATTPPEPPAPTQSQAGA
ncbi:MAG: 30S ribosomal protein S6 [Armatimonadetes bacterium]|nr:30S ribosomal protein S6 [Armatimonadota bacterium]MBI2202228.1 30S ribosomal protein S6 [Armatimonadota bacterium]MBI2246923.1 30S ribosomal protein S6 [Armatimonadota bacterium]